MKVKNSSIFLSVSFISTSVFSMDQSLIDQAKKVTQQMLECTRPIYEKKALEVLSHSPFEEHAINGPAFLDGVKNPAQRGIDGFYMLADLCKQRFTPLLEMLLQSKRACPNSSYTLRNGICITLLTEAIDMSLDVRSSSLPNRYSAVEVLLKYGADPNKDSISMGDHKRCIGKPEEEIYCMKSPLHRSIEGLNEELARILLSNNALPDKYSQKCTPVMHAGLCFLDSRNFENKMKAYRILQVLLDKGADINNPSGVPYQENAITTPMQFAKDKKLKEIIALFEQYQQGKK